MSDMRAGHTMPTMSDIDLLERHDDFVYLCPLPEATAETMQIRQAVNRRIMEAMMLQWAFGGPIRSSMTPMVSAAIGLLIARNGYGSLAGAAVGTGVTCLGPMFTRWHLRQYAEKHPDLTLASMAESWKAMDTGQGDAYAVRLERMKPGLESVRNGLRRRIGKLFVLLQTTASLRKLLAQVYTTCLTASPALQSTVETGKKVLLQEADKTAAQEKLELATLRETVRAQEEIIRQLQIEDSHDDEAAVQTNGRLDEVERTLMHALHQLGPLLEQVRSGNGSITLVHMTVESDRKGADCTQ